MASLIVKKLMKLPIGTTVELTYDEGDVSNQKITGVVIDNDEEENLEIRLDSGEELIVNYSLVRSFKTGGSAPVPPPPPPPPPRRTPLYELEPEDVLNRNDLALKVLFDQLPSADKKLLSGVYDSFKHGVRMNDRGKMEAAANQSRQIIFREDKKHHYWSDEAVLFCASLLRRMAISDSEVCLIANLFYEAALCSRRAKAYNDAGAYAITALLEQNPDHVRDLFIILAHAIVNTGDISGLKLLCDFAGKKYAALLQELTGDLLAAKGIRVTAQQDPTAALALLKPLYTTAVMEEMVVDWLPDDLEKQYLQAKGAPTPKPQSYSQPPVQDKIITMWGVIARVDWCGCTGVISGDDGKEYTFRYKDLANAAMETEIRNCMRADLGGKRWDVRFEAKGKAASGIIPTAEYVERARMIASGSRKDRLEAAYALCRLAMESGKDRRKAGGDLIRYALDIHTAAPQGDVIQQTLALYERSSGHFPDNAGTCMDVARCYALADNYKQALKLGRKSMDCPGQSARQKLMLLQQFLKLAWHQYDACGDRGLLTEILSRVRGVREEYSQEFENDSAIRGIFMNYIMPSQIRCECALDLLAEADRDFAMLHQGHPKKAELAELLEQTRQRMKPAPEPEPEYEPEEPDPIEETELPLEELSVEPEQPEDQPEVLPLEEEDEEVPPYTDSDGWDALSLTRQEVVDYALTIPGPERIAPMLAYLRAGAMLNPRIRPVYHTVALAANDPLESLDYSTTALITALADNDTDYPELNNFCMGAAFLRSSFLYGRDYDFSTQALRDSLSIDQQMDSFHDVCDTLETFRREVGRPIDIYAEYRNRDLIQLKAELEETVAYAGELYNKFVERESPDIFRLVRTKQLLFGREEYLATMLRRIMEQDAEGMEAAKEHFLDTYMNGNGPLESRHISQNAVDQMIAAAWEEAGRGMTTDKGNEPLQGQRRNNVRSSISDILRTVARWYVLSEQSAGLTWQTEQGEQAYARLRPVLSEQLQRLQRECDDLLEVAADAQTSAGLFLLSATAAELRGRLDGSWKCGQEKYLYVPLLRSGQVPLDKDLMPDLSATFCVLPQFNIFHRLRRHVEEPHPDWQAQIDRIYGPDTACNDYGTADQIAQWLAFAGTGEGITFPENRERFIEHTRMQIEIRYRSFLETYALAMNYGQIIKSDVFCYTLEDTVRYWHRVCLGSRNYGFFAQLLLHAEDQIHASARQYEQQLEEQLEALISGNQQYFDNNPDYTEAIRAQIANQNFTVAEDWMARIRIGDFSLEVQQPEALENLERFFSTKYVKIYEKVAYAKRSLTSLLGRREVHNKDTKRAQQLIDNWPDGGSTNSDRVGQLLNLLGWQNIRVEQYRHPTEPRTEIYQVSRVVDSDILTAPQHPIAAFGSDLERRPMYVICLYGIYDCDRLYDKMRSLDGIDGSKIILLDCALTQRDRRDLAWKLKRRESDLRNVNMVIDRVLISYLADNYNENLINRILMAAAMPFAYCQPYVVESVHTMPPEIFIGRKDELMKIEQPDGVSLIYGGRQLGKSALFKKAVFDLDGRRNQRAVLVDIKDLDCAAAARKVSTKLIDLGITPDAEITEDWDTLCRSIERRLRSRDQEIRYFLLMLDEADTFITDCADCGYRPLVALKDVQQSLPGKFKYVLAGLHNIVKFNRQVALGRNSVITHMPSLKITPFRTPEAQELLTIPLSYLGFSLPSKVTVSQILATCNYFPGLIQLYAKKLIESLRAADYAGYSTANSPPYVVTDEHLRRVMSDKEFAEQIREKFEITLTLDEDQGSCYYPLALLIGWMYYLVPSKRGYTAKEVLHHAQDLSVKPLQDLSEEKIDALLQELQDLNILRSVTNDSYLLASKNFRDLLGSDEEINEKLTRIGGGA